MRREQTQAYRDQFEYFADSFELIRKRGDALNIRSEALESERMGRYNARTGTTAERSHLLEIYRGIESEIDRIEQAIGERKAESELLGLRFPLDGFIKRYHLEPEEVQVLLVLLYNESVGARHARFTSGNEILNLLYPNPVAALKASKFLDGGATLFEANLVRANSDDERSNFLRAAYEVTEKTLSEVLGVKDRDSFRDQHHAARTSGIAPDLPIRIVAPRVSLDQVVLNPELRRRLDEVVWQAEEGEALMQRWGLDRVLEKGRGTVVLFSGRPGTGKTMTAEALADRLGRSLYVADFAQLESKWIGETEKNIVAVFQAAAEADAVLLLDEADAVLSSRLDGGHYNDRAYNRQVSILLTEIEAFTGLCVLTTNRVVSLDEALARRIAATFEFDVPGPLERERIWRGLLPDQVPLNDNVNLTELAATYALAGGHIKNAILSAVRRAALRDGETARVSQGDLCTAAAAEKESFQVKARGIGFRERDLGPSYS